MLLDVLRSMFNTDDNDDTNGAALAEAVRRMAGGSRPYNLKPDRYPET